MSAQPTEHPVVLVHGLFGWGEQRPLFGYGPDYFPLATLEQQRKVIAVDVGANSSSHDRACEAFAQLTGGRTDYGEAHACECCHARFGRSYERALEHWDATHPIHLVGHSIGGVTAVSRMMLLETRVRRREMVREGERW